LQDASVRMSKVPRAAARIREERAKLSSERGLKGINNIDDVEEQKVVRMLHGKFQMLTPSLSRLI
jgi:hypothetical protein